VDQDDSASSAYPEEEEEDQQLSSGLEGQSDLPRDLELEMSRFGREMWVWNEGEDKRMTRSRIKYAGDVRL
jgi:hypothetical protein